MDKIKRIGIGIVVVLVLCLTIIVLALNNNSENNNPIFINTTGDWSTGDGNNILLNLFFMDNKDKSIFEKYDGDLYISFDNPNLEVLKYDVNNGDSYKDIRLYSIVASVKSKEPGKQIISKIFLNYKGEAVSERNIGNITLNITEPNKNNDIRILENTGSANLFEKYQFSFQNEDASPIIIDEIVVGSFSKYINQMEIDINGHALKQDELIKLEPNSQLDVVIKFNENNEYDIQMFAPSIIYHKDNESVIYNYNFPFAIYGIPITEKLLDKIHSLYLLKN